MSQPLHLWRADQFPELTKLVDARCRRISSNDRSVDGADRNARDPVRVQSRFGKLYQVGRTGTAFSAFEAAKNFASKKKGASR